MSTNFKIQNWQDGKLIRLSSPYTRVRGLDFFYAFNFLAGSVGFSYLLLSDQHPNPVAILILIVLIIVCSICFYRFISKATEIEKLFINNKRMDIEVSSYLKKNKRTFLLSEIADFKFLDREKYEPHPLKGETFDYLGFQTEQRVIQDLYSEGRASFIYRGQQIRFGKELVSWEFNELEILLYELTGNDFRYTDVYERENFPKE